MKCIPATELFLFLFKVEDIYFFSDQETFDVIITGQAPMDFDQELVDGLRGLKWGSFTVAGIEKWAIGGPWHKGMPIGLGLKKEIK